MELTIERRHDLDWLRLIAIVILLFYHTGMWFNTWGWHVKNAQISTSFTYWMVWLHFWRMPLLLFISGAGTWMALGKRTPATYAGERFKRLFIPLVFGMFVVVPPQIYYEHIKEYSGYLEFYKTVFQFVPYPKGSFSWHHLWFVAYLLLFSLLALPALLFWRSRKSEEARKWVDRQLSKPLGILLIPSVAILISQIVLRPWFPEETHDLIHDWAYFVFYFSFFVMGVVCYSSNSLWQSIGNNRRQLLLAAALVLIPFYICYFHFHEILHLPMTSDTVGHIFDVSAIFLSWFTVITVIAYGQHYLNKPHPWLRYFNEGLYPFYILHQTVIIVVGYYVCQLDWNIASKYFTIAFLTVLACLIIYFLLIRPFKIVGLMFGVKLRKQVRN